MVKSCSRWNPDQIEDLIKQFGSPIFLFDPKRLESQHRAMSDCLDSTGFEWQAFYPYKTNSIPALVEALHAKGVGAELTTSAAAGRFGSSRPRNLDYIVSGPAKRLISDETLERSTYLSVENDSDVDRLLLRQEQGPEILIRVDTGGFGDPGSDPSSSWTERRNQFGWSWDSGQLMDVVTLLEKRGVTVAGLHFHLGGQIFDASALRMALGRISSVLEAIVSSTRQRPRVLNIGGGWASGFVSKTRSGPLDDLLAARGGATFSRPQRSPDLIGFAEVIGQMRQGLSALGVEGLIVENGRFLSEPAFAVAGTVIGVRHEEHSNSATLDFGVGSVPCIRPDERRELVVRRAEADTSVPWNFFGPECHRGDVVSRSEKCGPVREGDVVALDAVGAYCFDERRQSSGVTPAVVDIDSGMRLAMDNLDRNAT